MGRAVKPKQRYFCTFNPPVDLPRITQLTFFKAVQVDRRSETHDCAGKLRVLRRATS